MLLTCVRKYSIIFGINFVRRKIAKIGAKYVLLSTKSDHKKYIRCIWYDGGKARLWKSIPKFTLKMFISTDIWSIQIIWDKLYIAVYTLHSCEPYTSVFFILLLFFGANIWFKASQALFYHPNLYTFYMRVGILDKQINMNGT